MPDRRSLDLAVFELLGVTDAAERGALCDELYREISAHFRQIRVVEIQRQEQRGRSDGRAFRTDDEKQPLREWLAEQVGDGGTHVIHEGHASLPDASDFLDASTVFFRQSTSGKASVKSLALPSRDHAEIIFKLSQLGLHGPLRLPKTQTTTRKLKEHHDARLSFIAEKSNHLAHSRTSDDCKADELAGLLCHWWTHGKPSRVARQGNLDAAASN